MREQLLGFLIGALESDEHHQVEARLKSDSTLQHELELIHESLEPLRAGEGDLPPPPGLAQRTCQAIRQSSPATTTVATEPMVAQGRWSLADLAVAAGIFLAAGMLLLPAIQQSRLIAQRTDCQNNLRNLATALTQFSNHNQGFFPAIPRTGNQSAAGIYAVRLMEDGYLTDARALQCAAAPESQPEVTVPTASQLEAARGRMLAQLQRTMGGSYGYTLGYLQGDVYRPVKNRRRATFAIMADAPCDQLEGSRSANHGGCGQNVLYEDGHVMFLRSCTAEGCVDHIFRNDEGLMAAGMHEADAVVGHSWSRPLLRSTNP